MQKSEAVNEALKKIRESVAQMRAADSLKTFEEAWIEGLHRVERFWNKSTNHFSKSPKWGGWSGRYQAARTKDELLVYLINARGADEHTVKPTTGTVSGGLSIGPVEGQGSVHIRSLRMDRGRLSIDADGPVSLVFRPDRMQLLSVTNRGREYAVPRNHLGVAIDPDNVLAIAEAVLKYYSDFLAAAESALCE